MVNEESIYIFYQPVAFGGYHQTLVRVNASGVIVSIATSGPTKDPGKNPLAVSQAAGAAASGSESPYGTLYAESGPPSQFDRTLEDGRNYLQVLIGQPGNLNPHEIVVSGTDLSQQWNTIVQAEENIQKNNLPYSPLTQNSNSVASSALVAAGITPLCLGDGVGGLEVNFNALSLS